MKLSKLALVLGSALSVAAGAFVGTACSSSSSTGSGSGSGSGGTMDSGSGSDTSTETDSGTVGSDTGTETDSGTTMGPDCGSIPSLHANTAGDIYCGYGGDGGKIDCLTGTQCCLGGKVGNTYDPQDCVAWSASGTGCDNPAADAGGGAVGIACNQISDCTTNGMASATACCLQGASVAPLAGCGYSKAKGGTAVVCEASDAGTGNCAAGEITICSTNADCPTGKTCQPGKWKIYQIGFCQ